MSEEKLCTAAITKNHFFASRPVKCVTFGSREFTGVKNLLCTYHTTNMASYPVTDIDFPDKLFKDDSNRWYLGSTQPTITMSIPNVGTNASDSTVPKSEIIVEYVSNEGDVRVAHIKNLTYGSFTINSTDYSSHLLAGSQQLKIKHSYVAAVLHDGFNSDGTSKFIYNYQTDTATVDVAVNMHLQISSLQNVGFDRPISDGTEIYTVTTNYANGAVTYSIIGEATDVSISETGVVTATSVNESYSFTVSVADEYITRTLAVTVVRQHTSTFTINRNHPLNAGELVKFSETVSESIVDPDNNATPVLSGSYSYKWQVSADSNKPPGGWVDVATDSDYTVASDHVGKYVRVVLSYVDGAGFAHNNLATDNYIDVIHPLVVNAQGAGEYDDAGAISPGLTVTTTGRVDLTKAGLYNLLYTAPHAVPKSRNVYVRPVIHVSTHINRRIPTRSGGGDFTASDDFNELFSVGVVGSEVAPTVVHNVAMNVPGTYTVTFSLNATADDGVDISAAEIVKSVTVYDASLPVITLNGADSITLAMNSSYVEQNASATDEHEGSVVVNITSNVDMSNAGTYTVQYDATDSAGNKALTKTRTVIVEDRSPVLSYLRCAPKNVIVHDMVGSQIECLATKHANVVSENELEYKLEYKETDGASYSMLQDFGTGATMNLPALDAATTDLHLRLTVRDGDGNMLVTSTTIKCFSTQDASANAESARVGAIEMAKDSSEASSASDRRTAILAVLDRVLTNAQNDDAVVDAIHIESGDLSAAAATFGSAWHDGVLGKAMKNKFYRDFTRKWRSSGLEFTAEDIAAACRDFNFTESQTLSTVGDKHLGMEVTANNSLTLTTARLNPVYQNHTDNPEGTVWFTDNSALIYIVQNGNTQEYEIISAPALGATGVTLEGAQSSPTNWVLHELILVNNKYPAIKLLDSNGNEFVEETLPDTVSATEIGGKLVLNGESTYEEGRKYVLNDGIYTITGIPKSMNFTVGSATQSAYISASVVDDVEPDRTFDVTVGEKDESVHNLDGSSYGYYIDGVAAPTLRLFVGTTYVFDYSEAGSENPSEHPLILVESADDDGGDDAVQFTSGVVIDSDSNTLTLTVDESTPATLYYQCGAHGWMGGAIEIVLIDTKTATINVSGDFGVASYLNGDSDIGGIDAFMYSSAILQLSNTAPSGIFTTGLKYEHRFTAGGGEGGFEEEGGFNDFNEEGGGFEGEGGGSNNWYAVQKSFGSPRFTLHVDDTVTWDGSPTFSVSEVITSQAKLSVTFNKPTTEDIVESIAFRIKSLAIDGVEFRSEYTGLDVCTVDLGDRASAPNTSVTVDYIIGEDVTLVSDKTYVLSMQVVVNGTAFDLDNDVTFSTPASPVPVFEFKINRSDAFVEDFDFDSADTNPPKIDDVIMVTMTNLNDVNADASRKLEYRWTCGEHDEKLVVDDVFDLTVLESGALTFKVNYTDSLGNGQASLDDLTRDFGTVAEKLPSGTFVMARSTTL